METPEGYLASRDDAIFRNAQTGTLLKELSFEDTFEKVGNYYLMTLDTPTRLGDGILKRLGS